MLVRPCLRCLAALSSLPSSLPSSAAALSTRAYDMVDLQRSGAQVQVPRPPKARSRRAAEVSARVLQIQSGLAGQAKRREDYRKTLPAKTSNRGLLYLCVGQGRCLLLLPPPRPGLAALRCRPLTRRLPPHSPHAPPRATGSRKIAGSSRGARDTSSATRSAASAAPRCRGGTRSARRMCL